MFAAKLISCFLIPEDRALELTSFRFLLSFLRLDCEGSSRNSCVGMFSIDMELHLFDALGHVLACLDSQAVRVLALHGSSGHDGDLDEDLEDPLVVFWKTF